MDKSALPVLNPHWLMIPRITPVLAQLKWFGVPQTKNASAWLANTTTSPQKPVLTAKPQTLAMRMIPLQTASVPVLQILNGIIQTTAVFVRLASIKETAPALNVIMGLVIWMT